MQYNLEERTLDFSKRVLRMCNQLKKSVENIELVKQVVRSATSVGANYREANESLSKKDFLMRAKIARKECKETVYWIELIMDNNSDIRDRIKPLLQEAIELKKILSSIVEKSK